MKNLKLRAKIIEKFATQAEFANAIGWPEAAISRMVNGWTPPEPDREQVAEVLGTTANDFWPAV